MLTGYGAADALVVIDGENKPLGDKFDNFLRGFFGWSANIANIRKSEAPS